MDAVALLMVGLDALRHAEPEPANRKYQHVVAHPQFAGHDVHGADIAAVTVQQHHLAHGRARDEGADLGPDGNQGLDRMGQRAGKAPMFVALADLLARQEKHRAFCRQASATAVSGNGWIARSLVNPKVGRTRVLLHKGLALEMGDPIVVETSVPLLSPISRARWAAVEPSRYRLNLAPIKL